MLPQQTQQLINEQITKLPGYMEEALNAVPWQTELEKIAAKYRLDREMTNRFIVQTAFVLTGLLPPAVYASELQSEVGMEESLIKKIAPEIEERVFTVLQKYVLDHNAEKFELFQNEIEVLRLIGESDVDIFGTETPVTNTEMVTDAETGITTKVTTPQHDPYHEPVDPDDLLM